MEFDNIEAIKAVVAAGLGQSVIPGQAIATPAARGDLIVRPLQPPRSYTYALIHRRDRPLDDASKIVMKELATLGKKQAIARGQAHARGNTHFTGLRFEEIANGSINANLP